MLSLCLVLSVKKNHERSKKKEVLMSKFSPLTTTLVQDKNVQVHSYLIGRKPFLHGKDERDG